GPNGRTLPLVPNDRPTARHRRSLCSRDRRARWGLLVACALLTLSGCLYRATKPGETPLVGDIEIEGNVALSDDAIRDRIALTKSGFEVWPLDFGDRNPYVPDLLRADARRIQRLYEANG